VGVRGFDVTPDDLRSVAIQVRDCAEEAARNSSQLAGAQVTSNGSARGFECMTVAAACADGWVQATEVLGANLALSSDKLQITADQYEQVDQDNADQFGPR
jgi:hypothetical protein